MKRTALLITITVIVLAAGYLWFDKYYSNEPVTLASMVPSNAIAVYETSRGAESWEKLQSTRIWESLRMIDQIGTFTADLNAIDTLNGTEGGLSQLFSGSFLISMHLVGREALDFLYLADLDNYQSQFMINNLIQSIENDSTVTEEKRIYQDMEITELQHGEDIFSYLIYDNKLIASFTPFLVEDVIRGLSDENVKGFFDVHPSLLSMPKLSRDEGNLYLSIENLGDFTTALASPDFDKNAREIQRLGAASFLDLSVTDESILLNGFTDEGEPSSLLSTWSDQGPVENNFKFFLPTNTAVFQQYAFSDAVTWYAKMVDYWKIHESAFFQRRAAMLSNIGMDPADFSNTIGNSVSLIKLEIPGSSAFVPLIAIDVKDDAGMRSTLNTLGESIARAEGDTTYIEQYGSYEIRELNINEFPQQLFGPDFNGFERTYFTFTNTKTLIFSPDLISIKEFIDAVESENTWGRSVFYNTFLDGILKESNYTMIINSRRAWDNMLTNTDPVWRKFAIQNAAVLKSFGLISIQFSKLSDNFYTSILIQNDGQPVQLASRAGDPPKVRTELSSEAITKPFVVTSHVDNSLETIVQDSARNIYLIDKNGNVQWSFNIGQPVNSKISQVDFYANGKLQYFFTTDSAIHIVDRTGNYVEGYPKRVSFRIKYASVIDYDKSKKYRYVLSDGFGRLTLMNKEGIPLEGWDPRDTGGRLSSGPFHVRVRGRDCLVAVEASGKVHIMNRRGEYYPGFPLDLESRIESPPHFTPGANFEGSEFTVVDREGRLTSFNLMGKITSSEQLYKPTTETTYSLVPDVLGKTFILARYDSRRLVLLNRNQEELMSKDFESQPDVQFYDFGSDVQVYLVRDNTEGLTYAYDHIGKLIGSGPLRSKEPVALLYSELSKQFTIYYVSGNEVLVRTF